MPTFYSPAGNAEIWDEQPEGHVSAEEWERARAAEEAAAEAARLAEYNRPENAAARKIAAIDAETSAAIIAGFDYNVKGETYHFSYDTFDQQNFTDTASVALLAQMGGQGLPESVIWNAYRKTSGNELVRLPFTAESFLTLYTAGAVAHKAACMAKGGTRKAAVAEALERGATAEEIESI